MNKTLLSALLWWGESLIFLVGFWGWWLDRSILMDRNIETPAIDLLFLISTLGVITSFWPKSAKRNGLRILHRTCTIVVVGLLFLLRSLVS